MGLQRLGVGRADAVLAARARRRRRRGPARQTGSPSAPRTGRPRPTSTIRSWSVSSSARPSAKTWSPTRWLQRRRQVAARVAIAPEAKRRVAVEAVGTSRPGKSRAVAAGGEAVDLDDVAGEEAGEVEDVGRLLDDLPAGAVLAAPPLGRRRLVEPVARHQVRRVVARGAAGPRRRCRDSASGSRRR